jgi:hypothetical protein
MWNFIVDYIDKKYGVSKKRTEKWRKKRWVKKMPKQSMLDVRVIPYQGLSDQKEVGCGEQDNP